MVPGEVGCFAVDLFAACQESGGDLALDSWGLGVLTRRGQGCRDVGSLKFRGGFRHGGFAVSD